MSVQKLPAVSADADLTAFVSRDAAGDLRTAVRERLRKLDGVTNVDEFELCGLQPGLNDLTVEVRTTLVVELDADAATGAAARRDAAALEAQLLDSFGVKEASVVSEVRDVRDV
ncbi:hypothetical protein AUR64_14160 [Haloprofundus marisrubri]|uniref:Uncharacterized protein n=1 Tax=Haloprofundus marisrubri TaxID=1514971 RepID=A0A0W1R7X2_9EURY|nr:hypothetical protein [Haloprofundus marisrubri]KTG08949.1 hypothetical protein AUR64_14160 [Haloprofundus marisrubri]